MENMVNGMIQVNVHIHVDHMEQKNKNDCVTTLHQVMVEKAVKNSLVFYGFIFQTSKPFPVTETLIAQVRLKTLIVYGIS